MRRAAARPGPASNSGALDNAGSGQDDAGSAQRGNNCSGDGLPAIGAPGSLRCGLNHHRQVSVRRWAKTQGGGEQASVVRHCLRALRIPRERSAGNC